MIDEKRNYKDQTLELFAVTSNLLFTFLYIKQSSWAFFFGVLGPLLLALVLRKKRLLAETALQGAYIVLTFLGLVNTSMGWNISSLNVLDHLCIVSSGFGAVLLLGFLLKKYSNADLPYLDSFTTVFALIATFLMMCLIHEAWLYWIVINGVSVILYMNKKLYFGVFMFLIYLFMSIDAYFRFGILT